MPSALNHLDWSMDSQTVIVTNTSYYLEAYSLASGKLNLVTRMSSLIDTEWKTWSLNLGFPV